MKQVLSQLIQAKNDLKNMNKNAKRVLIFEPFFTIPYSMFVIYSSIYMTRMGVKDYQIGLLSTILNISMLIFSPIAGLLVNRFGRKKVLFLGDFFSWCVYAYIFFFARDFKWFLIATIFNGLLRIPELAWRLLLIEDANENERVAIYSLTVLIWNVGNLFSPLMGIFVARWGVIQATRTLALIFGIMVTFLIILRHLIITETKVGNRTILENKKSEKNKMFKLIELKDSIKYIVEHKEVFLTLSVIILNNFIMTFRDTYRNIYFSEALKFKDQLISVFPTISAIVTIIFVISAIPSLKEKRHDNVLFYSFVLITVSNVLFLTAPSGIIGFIIMILVTLINAVGSAVYFSFADAILANSIDENKRANVLSISMLLISLFSMPIGAIAGKLYDISKLLPFIVATVCSLIACVLVTMKMKLMDSK